MAVVENSGGTRSAPGVKAAVLSSSMILFAAVVQVAVTVAGFVVYLGDSFGRLVGFAAFLYILGAFLINVPPFVLAIVDLWRGGLRTPLTVFILVFLTWHTGGLVGVVVGTADDGTQLVFGIGVSPAVTIVYQVVMTVLLATALVLLVRRGRWNSGMRDLRRLARGYYTADLPYPSQAGYPPLEDETR